MNDLIQQDQQQRLVALNPRESFIVQAPAGSGKTELIIQRLLTLLSHVRAPEEILAITFTKKAAHEMRARVLKALEFAATHPEPDKPHEKLTWQLASKVLRRDEELKWSLINNPNQLQVKTIDSFCTFLTGQLPLLSHFGSQPDIAVSPQPLYREAVYEVLAHVEENHPWSPAVAKLLTHLDNDLNKLARLLVKMLENRDQWQRYLNLDLNDQAMRHLLSQQIADVVQFNLQNAYEIFPGSHADELLTLLRFSNRSDATILSGADFSLWQAIANMLLTKQNTWRKVVNEEIGFGKLGDMKGEEKKTNQAMRARHKALVEALIEDEMLRATLENIRALPEPEYSDQQWEILKALLQVLKVTLAQLRVTFQGHGQIDFIENAWGARQALGDTSNPTDLALALAYQIQHILVDEFQDTSHSQHNLLLMLTHGWQPDDGRTLFVVGDPMQSIYRFRQAEVGLFIRMQQEGIGAIKLTPLKLAVNFRSDSSIVNWNNQRFSAIFPQYSDIGTGAVHYSESIAHQEVIDNNTHQVTMSGFLKGDDKHQAQALIEYIRYVLQEFPAEKIAILVRSRSHLSAIVPILKAEKIPYQAVDIDPLAARQSIQDLLALTRALLHPADRIAWLAILRAPWCGLTLADLLIISGDDRYQLIWERLNNPSVTQQLSKSGYQRVAAILPALQHAMQNRERSGFRQWIELTWQAIGGPATLTEYSEMADANEYFTLLEELSGRSHEINLELLNERIQNLRASTHDEKALVQIMTIHSSKGLEFDTVILPHLECYNARRDQPLLQWMEHPLHAEKIALLLAPLHATDSEADALYKYIDKLQRVKEHFEIDRLLYVATTRAKKRLHLIFNVENPESTSQRGSFLDKLWPLIQKEVILEEIKQQDDASAESPIKISRPVIRVQENWHNPYGIALSGASNSQQSHSGFLLRDQTARLIGTITHSVLQQISQHSIDWWQSQSAEFQHIYIKREMQRSGLLPNQENLQTIYNMITATLNDERGRWILSPHQAAQSELKLTITTENGFEQIIIDRTFIDEHGVRWIIDYKTGIDQDNDLPAFLKKQQTKYQDQMNKYIQAMQLLEARAIKTGLYFPAMAAWCESF